MRLIRRGRFRLKRIMACLGMGVLAMTADAHGDRAVRVVVAGGVPRIEVDGKPVRARMFFGGPGSSPIRIGPEGRRIEFEFISAADSHGIGTMHLRFGHMKGRVWLDDIRVTDAKSGQSLMPPATFEGDDGSFRREWQLWPPGERNTVGHVEVVGGSGEAGTGGLSVTIKDPPGGDWPDFHIHRNATLGIEAGRAYRVSFWARAEPARDLMVGFYRPGQVYVHLGGPPGRYENQIRLAADAGVDFVSFVTPTPWPKPGEEADWSAVDLECERVLRANPRALLLPRFGLEPPGWWAEAHPDHMMTWEDGSKRHTAIPASPLYRREAAARARALVAHLEARFGDRMAGYHPCGQNTGEWFYEETWGGLFNGYARADAETWRDWLRKRYGDDAKLQAAWRTPDATLDGADVPTAAQRRASPNGALRDPGTERRLVDFAQYQQDAMADLVCELARATREASRGRKLVVFFYGYAYEFGGVALGPATSGHYAMRRVLNCPDIDILCSPISYGDRGLAQTGPVMSAAESVPLTGSKMWLQEDDTRTHMSPDEPDAIARLKTPWETEAVLTRNVANEATRNMATWWMDLGMVGWFDDPLIWDVMKRLRPLDQVFLASPTPFRPEVASVMHEKSMMLVAPFVHDVTGPVIYHARQQLGRLGAPYGQYLFDDVAAGRVRARVYVFHNAWWLDAAERRAVRARTRGSVRVWSYAPGAYDADGPSPKAMQELTGFRLRPVSVAEAWATPTPAGERLGLRTAFGLRKAVKPLFAVADAKPSEALATYPDGSVAVALRKTSDGHSLFVGAPALTPDLLRVAARAAGVHLYADDDTCVWANGPVVTVQAVRDGPVTITLPRKAVVKDLLTGADVGNGKTLTIPMRRGEVRVLRMLTGSARNGGR